MALFGRAQILGGRQTTESSEESELANVVHWWDFSTVASPDVGDFVALLADLVGSADMAESASNVIELAAAWEPSSRLPGKASGGINDRMTTTALAGTSQPVGVAWIGRHTETGGITWFDFDSGNPRPHASSDGTWRMNAGTSLPDGLHDFAIHVWYVEFNGASSKMYMDGVLVASGNAGSTGNGTVGSLFNNYAGGVGAVTNFVEIGEMVVASGTQTGGAITAEYDRMYAKWIGGAQGGGITYSGGYTYHTFKYSGTFDPGSLSPLSVDYCVVAGGGGGGSNMAGGGGGGEVLTGSTSISAAQSITIGAGGTGGLDASGTVGSNTVLGSIATANGGGYGGKGSTSSAAGGNGGNGGGGGADNTGSGKAGGTGDQFNGGTGESSGGGSGGTAAWCGGGGAGAGAAGGNGGVVTADTGGTGGDGIEWPSGSGTYYGGGGGGGATWGGGGGAGGLGGAGGGGDGKHGITADAEDGTPNTGGGGGGAGSNLSYGGDGGSGIVIIRYLTP